jgi:L-histidine N-alpha-methyltransferase
MIRMSATANVGIHSSQFPDQIRRDLIKSLRTRQIAHKFHYDSVKQTQQWLALHQRYSPSRTDDNCRAVYEQSFSAAARTIKAEKLHVIGLGCGGGQKDSRLIARLERGGNKVFYTPCDVAPAMVLTARRTALSVLPDYRIYPLVCDLQTANDLPPAINLPRDQKPRRIITFFGMIPNFEPDEILPKLASLIRRKDVLLFSANLAPGGDYATGMRRILPQYNNDQTRDWLLTFLIDLGITKNDGTLLFDIENARHDLKRIGVHFRFKRACQITIDDEVFAFKASELIRLFFSYRYRPDRMLGLLSSYGLKTHQQWITKSGEEGVFLCSR